MRAFWDTKAYLDIYINRRQFWKRREYLELFILEEAILRRKKFNRRRMMEWRYHQAIYHQKWSEAIDPTVFSSGDVHDDLSVLSVVCAEKKSVKP